MCQGCVEEGRITQKVYDAIEAFLKKWPNSDYGPAHVVIADDNVEVYNIQSCLDEWDNHWSVTGISTLPFQESGEHLKHDPEELAATKEFLKELLTWPIEDRLGPNREEQDEEINELA